MLTNRISLNEPEMGAVIAGLVVLSAQMHTNPHADASVRDILSAEGRCMPLTHGQMWDLAQRLNTGV